MSEIIRVGMADYKICHSPCTISTLGLGSCIGVVFYDEKSKICALAHIMLPNSQMISNNKNRMKFVDTCLADMYESLLNEGVSPHNLKAKMAGGARMFAFHTQNEHLNIGERNVEAAIEFLKDKKIPLISQDTGSTYGRTIEFSPDTCELQIKVVGAGIEII